MKKNEEHFIKTVWQFYKTAGRSGLPWRLTKDPYRILVSEVMLQQTQVERVLPKYKQFLEQYPTVCDLAQASLADVLRVWQGLGYNRRAKMLHQCAQMVVNEHAGRFPTTYSALVALPGVGPYTAGAVMAFAYNQAVPMIETNIRTVYLHHFFKDKANVTDKELMRYIERTQDTKRAREWYSALMDYGSHLKKTIGNQNHRAQNYTKQSSFAGSDRQIRGAILRVLMDSSHTRRRLKEALTDFSAERVCMQLESLCQEGMVIKYQQRYSLPF